MYKAVLAYNRDPRISAEDYERWLFEVHVPDLLANPFIDRIVFNTTTEVIERASDGTSVTSPDQRVPFRVAEFHFADEASVAGFKSWFRENPPSRERGPSGRTDFMFYVIAESIEVTRQNMQDVARAALVANELPDTEGSNRDE